MLQQSLRWWLNLVPAFGPFKLKFQACIALSSIISDDRDLQGKLSMSSSGIPGDAGKKMKCHKKYSSEWEDEPEFHGWLKASSKGSSYYFCSACKAHLSLNAGKVDIRRHAVGKKHTKNLTMASGQRSVLDLPSVSGNQSIERQVKEGEIRLASFICEHDIPIRVVDHIPQLLHAICPDSQIAKNMKCGRTKLTSVVNNVTGKQNDKYLEKTPLSKIALSDPRKLKPLTSIYLGAKVGMTLSQQHNIPPHAIKEFKQNCLAFYIEGATQIRTRFAFNDVSFKQLEALDPRVVKDKSLPSLAPLMSSFPTLVNDNDIQNVDNEWQLLRQTELVNEGCSTPLKFWLLVRDAKSGNGDPMFPNLSRLMLNLLCLPHSSATVERVFSAVNRQKTKLRNRLSIKTLSGILHTKRLLEDKSCFNFPISTKMVHMMQSEIYKKECAATGNADDSDEDVV
ncbi:hypothetical protein Pcinc_025308 [Petrolisthes cinctipes]|uniref:HAT C-terminal dimerisation domain-containing protein n=1 Tax=Petrolisthes cinctipes TaxID=88211 RepID=A0AAE1F907_PETCI|nr:hypothetical protein Pcinc_025308 [Petrolisthes cinctipes]